MIQFNFIFEKALPEDYHYDELIEQ